MKTNTDLFTFSDHLDIYFNINKIRKRSEVSGQDYQKLPLNLNVASNIDMFKYNIVI